uniref:Uncharacterized protein n=1 Tax=Lotus japonicus TaxID=34305 RepID=I3SHM8_LOTJA|nr:unknown [Lotus japonicus]
MRLSRLSSSIHDLFSFFGFLMSFSSTSSFQLVPSLLSFLSRLLSLAVSWWVSVDSTVAEIESLEGLVWWREKEREGREGRGERGWSCKRGGGCGFHS